ncbi:hypothetical protein EMCRGX_G027131 [Ephydatia muelleri]
MEGSELHSEASKKLAASRNIEDLINLHHMVELQKLFCEFNSSRQLSVDEFTAKLGSVLGRARDDPQLTALFMKIDTNCDETVDWDEFCTYILLGYQERETMDGEKLPPFPYPLHELPRPKRCVWVTDLIVMPNLNKILLSFTSCTLSLYDISSTSFEKQFEIVGFPYCIVTMDYWFNSFDQNKAVLVMGDNGGGVYTMEFDSATTCLFGVMLYSIKQEEVVRLTFYELQSNKLDGTKITYNPTAHGDWVCQVRYCSAMQYCISCSHHSGSALLIANTRSNKGNLVFKVWKGISTFDFAKDWSLIATGSIDGILRFWNPYVPAKPVAVLRGHSSAITHVVIHYKENQVLSFSQDMELRVWGIVDQQCVQICSRFQQLKPENPPPIYPAFYLHPYMSTVLVGTNKLGALQSRDYIEECEAEVLSHQSQLCAALYSPTFGQVISGSHDSVVNVWDVTTGERLVQFSCYSNTEITTMALVPRGRQLVTGARNGCIKIWNFSNGACLTTLKNDYEMEITSICCWQQSIITGGWNRRITLYWDSPETDKTVPKYWGQVHCEDILCLAQQGKDMVASASYDGELVVWKVGIQQAVMRLHPSRTPTDMHRVDAEVKGKEEEEEERNGGSGSSEDSKRALAHRTIGRREERAIEKLAFLCTRPEDQTTATLVACGTAGWVRFWNVYGGGLIGEFNSLDVKRYRLKGSFLKYHSVTACTVKNDDSLMVLGNSLGYLQIYDITAYCGHMGVVVSVEMVEDRDLIVSASTDCCVRVWTTSGRYIGTFGERQMWHVGVAQQELPRKCPPGMTKTASFSTLQVVSGPSPSKWKRAKSLFKLVYQNVIASGKSKEGAQTLDDASDASTSNVLGRCYHRRSRFRQPVGDYRLEGRVMGIYFTLKCPTLEEDNYALPVNISGIGGGDGLHSNSSQQ